MNKLDASVKDASARRASVSIKHYFKVGSCFKGCRHCGTTEMRVSAKGRAKEVWLDGFNVFRSYDPKFTGWTWWCYDCAAKDFDCWDCTDYALTELGQPPVQGVRSAKQDAKDRRLSQGAYAPDATKVKKIVSLELQLKQLQMLKGNA